MSASTHYCTFHVGNLFFGVEVEKVQEVIRFQEITPVPLASPVVQGLINLRGQITTAIDLRRCLELSTKSASHPPINVVICTEDGPMNFLVDTIGDVVEVTEDTFESAPETLRGGARQIVRGAYKLKDRLMLTIDVNRAIQHGSESCEQQGPPPT